jgi:ribosomal protein S27AE
LNANLFFPKFAVPLGMNQPINCPSCGAALKLKFHAAKMVVCNYCGQTSFLNADRWTAQGEKTVLADYGSVLAVGRTGKLQAKAFTVLGRLRMAYPGGFWDEWLLQMADGKEAWLQEDEGNFTLFQAEALNVSLPKYETVAVGKTIQLQSRLPFFVMEKEQMKVEGAEGELPMQVVPGMRGSYAEGVSLGQPMSLEYFNNDITFNRGTPVAWSDLKLDKQAEYV